MATLAPNDPHRPIEVSISCGGEQIVAVPQRDLFSKYGWPAEQPIKEALNKFKDND